MGRVRAVTGTQRTALDQGWEFAVAPAGSAVDRSRDFSWRAVGAPTTAAATLRALGSWSFDTPRDFDAEDFWWRLRLDEAVAGTGPAVLGFDGLATLADVWLDGKHLLRSENMFLAHALPVVLDGQHELLIRCAALAPELAVKRPRPRWRVPMVAHAQLRWFRTSLLGRTPGWSPPCPAVGPWRPVWLERREHAIGEIVVDAGLDGTDGVVDIVADLGDGVETADLVVERGDRRATAALTLQDGRWRGRARIAEPALWWPHTHGEPARYAVAVQARTAGRPLAIDLGHCGFRRIAIDRDGGDFAVRVNGVDVFCRGACWTPLDVVSLAATREDQAAAVAQAVAAGMNMLRIGGTMTYEDDALLDALDAQGVLLWQDLMFANMDYPEDDSFVAAAAAEVEQQLARLRGRPALALVCGNSEVEQQAAMSGAGREHWSPSLFHDVLAAHVRAAGIEYIPSSAHGGAFPHAADSGATSYYGVGAYLRPFDDARRCGLRFASECLAFANIPHESGLPGGPGLRVHHAAWKARSPRDLGAGWDFDDVRDHYVAALYGVDPAALRASDHERYLALGRAASGEAMARAFAEWRRAASPTRGALVFFLRDLWPGAGWGVVDANGRPKPCWYALRRALAPCALAITDEGVNGLYVHIANDRAEGFAATLEIDLHRLGDQRVGHAGTRVDVPARGACTIAAAELFEGFLDLSFAYRFGPPLATIVHARLLAGDAPVADAFWFPVGLPGAREADVGLAVASRPGDDGTRLLEVGARRFAQSIAIDAPGFVADDEGFHLAPGQTRQVRLRPVPGTPAPAKGTLSALNAEATARFDLR